MTIYKANNIVWYSVKKSSPTWITLLNIWLALNNLSYLFLSTMIFWQHDQAVSSVFPMHSSLTLTPCSQLHESVGGWPRACLTYRGLVFVDAYCSQLNRLPLQSRCVNINTKEYTNNPIIPHFFKNIYNGQIFPASSSLLLQNGSRKRVKCICITVIWLAAGSGAAWKVERFSTFWRRPRSRMDGRTHNAFRERPMQKQWDLSTDGGSVNKA